MAKLITVELPSVRITRARWCSLVLACVPSPARCDAATGRPTGGGLVQPREAVARQQRPVRGAGDRLPRKAGRAGAS